MGAVTTRACVCRRDPSAVRPMGPSPVLTASPFSVGLTGLSSLELVASDTFPSTWPARTVGKGRTTQTRFSPKLARKTPRSNRSSPTVERKLKNITPNNENTPAIAFAAQDQLRLMHLRQHSLPLVPELRRPGPDVRRCDPRRRLRRDQNNHQRHLHFHYRSTHWRVVVSPPVASLGSLILPRRVVEVGAVGRRR